MAGASHRVDLLGKIERREATVGVVGLGYVGLPFALEAAAAGFPVIGFDVDPAKVAAVQAGESYLDDVPGHVLRASVQKGRLGATVSFERVRECDVVVVCVPTPLTRNMTPDLGHVEAAARAVAANLRAGALVSLESTTFPGTTDDIVLPILLQSGLTPETEVFVAYSPERVDPGNKKFGTRNTTKICGAIGPASLEVASAFYRTTIDRVVPVSSARTAEMVKVYENTFRAVNIALVNEFAVLCDRMGLDTWEVLDAAFTKPFGIMPFYPGPGVGGHCIALDPHYLEWKAREVNFSTQFIRIAGEINRNMPAFVCTKAVRMLNDAGLSASRARVLVLGAAYKRDVSDHRESPAIEVMRILRGMGADVSYHDPHVPAIHEHDVELRSVALDEAALEAADLVVIATDHSSVDYSKVVGSAKRILDTRNATRNLVERANVKLL